MFEGEGMKGNNSFRWGRESDANRWDLTVIYEEEIKALSLLHVILAIHKPGKEFLLELQTSFP